MPSPAALVFTTMQCFPENSLLSRTEGVQAAALEAAGI